MDVTSSAPGSVLFTAYSVLAVQEIRGPGVQAARQPALHAHRVTGTDLTRRASDHLPVTVEYEPAAIVAGPTDQGSSRGGRSGSKAGESM